MHRTNVYEYNGRWGWNCDCGEGQAEFNSELAAALVASFHHAESHGETSVD